MRLLDSIYLRLSQLPELLGLEKSERKRIVRSCRWKVFRHWQYWLISIVVFFFSLILSGIISLWYLNLKIRFLSQPLISLSAFMSVLLILALVHLTQRIKIYYLAPYLVQAMADGLDETNNHDHNQQLRKKSIKKGLWLFVPSLLIVFVCVAIAMQNPDGSGAKLKMPDELNTPRIVKSLQGVTKKVFLEDKRLGVITEIVFQNNSSGKLSETIFAGTTGALFTGSGLPTKFIPFDKNQEHIKFIQLNSSRVYGFMSRGSWINDARVMDISGKPIWSYSAGTNGIDDMASGDLDGDGIPKFAVGFNGGGGIHLLNINGKKLWEFPDGNVWHVEIADLDGSGQKKIVHSNAKGNITVRDKQGKIISKSKPNPYFAHFSLIRWPDTTGPERLLLVEDNTVWIFDAAANVLAKFPAPDSGSYGKGRGALITLNNGKRALATIVDYENWHRSIIYLYDLSEKILYQEILPESCPSIAVLPSGEVEQKRLVIGCESKVIEYRIQ